jgi:hypothetical protein
VAVLGRWALGSRLPLFELREVSSQLIISEQQWSDSIHMSPFELSKSVVEQNFVLCQPLRPARKRAGSWSRGAYI